MLIGELSVRRSNAMHLLEIDESIAVGVISVQACLVVLPGRQGEKTYFWKTLIQCCKPVPLPVLADWYTTAQAR